jgi:putative tryptophan/tyrosine transport system substrate-binding protein
MPGEDSRMRRREFIAGLGAIGWPLAANAQGRLVPTPRIGIMDDDPLWDNFRQGLRDLGYVENENIAIEYRSAEDKVDRLAQTARDLVSLPVDVIVVSGTPAARAARQATSTIPIVLFGIGDPVRAGLVDSLARPGGNVTGYSEFSPDLIGKRLEILKQCVPALARVALLWNPDNDSNLIFLEELIIAVPALGLQLISVPIRNADEFERAFATMMRRTPNAAVVTGDPLLIRHITQILDFTEKNRMPTMYQQKRFVVAGGLMSYGVDMPTLFRRGTVYVHKILHGAKPADLPIEQPTRFELVINLKTAKALGLTIPETLLAIADEVIQ